MEKIFGNSTAWLTKNYGHIRKTVDLATDSGYETVATHELFTVTGVVRFKLMAYCTENLTSDGVATIKLGHESNTAALIAATTCTNIDNGHLWYSNTPASYNTAANVIFEGVSNGLDLGYEIETAATTNGTLVFELWWEGISAGSTVAAGGGGVL